MLEGYVDYKFAKNKTDGFGGDLIEAIVQKYSLKFDTVWEMLSGLQPVPDEVQSYATSELEEYIKSLSVEPSDLAQHIIDYSQDISQGRKVLVVAHSQGNFFANQAYNLLADIHKPSWG
ncbi:hypothetical protein F0231_05350 [Vibrio sp. RE86]|uniref:hypothetical protein n=1 Tax=Vibrio sp. RE86 TaxID=2607605 RepID=UPI00149346B5|nr:hypothetical protein [Vibrio sp. RE86]NOH79164.1 hypothetical protein [Vibrio sp. RE86]